MAVSNIFKKGSTSQITTVTLRDSTTGQLKTGVAFGSITITYHRQGASPTTVSVVTATAGAYTSGGWVETSVPGVYQFGIPNAALATGAEEVTFTFSATGVIDREKNCILVDSDLRDAAGLGLSRLDDTVSSRLASASYTAPLDAAGTRSAMGLSTNNLDTQLAAIVAYIDTEVAAIKAKTDNLPATPASSSDCLTAASVRAALGLATNNLDTQLATLTNYVDTEVAAIKAKTDNLPATPASSSDCITEAGVRSALGMSAANLDIQLAALASYVDTEVSAIINQTTATAIRAALGLATASLDTDLSTVKADTAELKNRISAVLFSGITRLSRWLGALAGKTSDPSTLAEIQATTAGSTYNNATDSLEAILDRGNAAWVTGSGGGGGSGGSGAYVYTITVDDGTTPLQGAIVRLVEGVTVLTQTTDANGQVSFSVDAASWSVSITKSGYSFTPTTLVVTGTDSTTYSMDQVAITPDPDPDKSVVVVTCYDENTDPEQGVEINITLVEVPSGSENVSFDSTTLSKTSDVDGVVSFTLWKNATYEIRRSKSKNRTRFIPSTDVYSITSFFGSP